MEQPCHRVRARRFFRRSSERSVRTHSGSGARPAVSTALYLSLVTPEIVMGVSLLAFFQWLFRYLNVHLGMHTVVLAHMMFCIAYVVIVVIGAAPHHGRNTRRSRARSRSERMAGVSRASLCPLLFPAVAAAALLAFTISFDDYVITSMVAGVDSETLPMVIYAMARRGPTRRECHLDSDRRRSRPPGPALGTAAANMTRRRYFFLWPHGLCRLQSRGAPAAERLELVRLCRSGHNPGFRARVRSSRSVRHLREQ